MPEHSSNPQLQQRVLRQALLERAFVQALEQDIITDLYLLVLALAPNPEQITREGYEGTRSVTPEAQSAEESEGDSRSPEQPDPSALLKDAVTSGWQLTGGSLNSVGWRGERGPNDSAGASRRGLERSPLPVTGPALNIASSGRSSILPRGHALNAYDNVGNLTKKTSQLSANTPDPKQSELTYDLSYTYNGKPHQATQVGTQHYQYDENGNLTSQTPDWAWNGTTADPLTFVTTTLTPGKAAIDQAIGENRTLVTTVKTGVRRLTWDWDNRLRKVKDDQIEVSYDYDVDGERRLKTLGTSETVYADKMQQIDIGGAVPLATVNIFLGDTRLVSKLVPLDKPSVGYEKDNTFYYHADHIGNSTLITNSKGQEYQRFQFTPHGEIWHEDSSDAVSQIDYLFTGKQVDSETGWYNFGARYMDPKTGLWLSSDPALDEYIPRAPLTKEDKEANGKLPGNGGIYNPVNFALYHFAGNNPIKYTDPDGRADIWSLKNDPQGLQILSNYLYGGGKPLVIKDDPAWSSYMMANPLLTEGVRSEVNPLISTLKPGDTISVDITTHMEMENGEGIIGYQYLHGTNADVGDFKISGTISMDDRGAVKSDLTFTWNDKIDPNFQYSSDKKKADLANIISFGNAKDYTIQIIWSDKSGANQSQSYGWILGVF